MSEQRVLRKSHDCMLAGVVAGLAEYVGWPAKNMRILYVLLSIISAAFPGTIVYIILYFTMPDAE
ncbi:MAG: PspC domain-containing protein [bacterium]|nr:PspC domain-containing protein [bacterium]